MVGKARELVQMHAKVDRSLPPEGVGQLSERVGPVLE